MSKLFGSCCNILVHPAFKLVFGIWSVSLILKLLVLNIKEHLEKSIT